MSSQETSVDELLAAALRGEVPAWQKDDPAALGLERILYHGLAGLIAESARELADWPCALMKPVREQAIAQAMWEMRHKVVLSNLVAAFADSGIVALVLKGSALAYDLYAAPASRSRGDSDILISPTGLAKARKILVQQGFSLQAPHENADDLALQEVWSVTSDRTQQHCIDLHWQLLNAPALSGVLTFADCAAKSLALPRLGPGAYAMNRVLTLLHICVHRAMHIINPYFVDGRTYYGGDRLIWAKDIDLLSAALTDRDWQILTRTALDQGVAKVCLDGLRMARRSLGTEVPQAVIETLGAAGNEPASAYLLDLGPSRRAWRDLVAVPGWSRKLAYLGSRALPSESFMRAKYADHGQWPLVWLHGRRMVDLFRARTNSKTTR